MIQLFFNHRFQNWALNPELAMHMFFFPKGDVRVEMIRPSPDFDGWDDEFPPNWDAGVPITTFMRKLARTGEWFAAGGFYRLRDNDFNSDKE